MDRKYSISEVAKLLQIEQNNLRTMERQLELSIPRGEGNRRYYREEEIKLLKDIQLLRGEGFQLRMIKMILPKLPEVVALESGERRRLRQCMKRIISDSGEGNHEEMDDEEKRELAVMDKPEVKEQGQAVQGYAMFGAAMTELLQSNNKVLLEEMDARVSERIMKEMNFLFRERENLEEERYRKLDRTIREYQMARQSKAIQEERRTIFFRK